MKKNIVILDDEIANDYSFSVIEGIQDFFKDKDVNLIIIATRLDYVFSSSQHSIGLKLAETKQIDGIIVLSTIYLSSISKEQLSDLLKNVYTDNIVSISTKLPIKNSVYTAVNCEKAYNDIIKHLKEVHGCKRIAFMSATATGSVEATERFDAFKKALNKNGLEFDENLKFEGYFVFDKALYALQNRYKSAKDVDFDAILAANDMMAFACETALEFLGLKIPDDVKIFGYDDVVQAQTAEIPLSTINQQMRVQGAKAAELAYLRANGKKVPEKTLISSKAIFRQSCGCCGTESEILDKLNSEHGSKNVSVTIHLEKNMIQQNVYFLIENLQNEVMLDMLYNSFDTLLNQNYVPGIAICMYDKPLFRRDDEPLVMPEKATVTLFIDITENIKEININDSFNPNEMVLPEKYFGSKPGTFMIHPIFFGHKQYGYFVCKTNSNNYLLSMIYLKTFSALVSHSYNYTETVKEVAKFSTENLMLQIDNDNLNEMSMNDSLTGIFNRRGLMETGQESIDLSLKLGKNGAVFFADMDFLKQANDIYGHDMGDKMIIAMSKVFKRVFRQNDVIARLGGDEFAGVLPGYNINIIDKTWEKIKNTCIEISKEEDLPITLQVSFAVVEFNQNSKDLSILLKQADTKQYQVKKEHHNAR